MVPLELPGHGQRLNLPLLDDLQQMVNDILEQVTPYIQNDYILWGHSLGGTLGNLLLHRLQADGGRLPLYFLVTGCAAPKLNQQGGLRHLLPDQALRDTLKELGGLQEEALNNKMLMDFFLPIIRKDLRALELYQYEPLGKYDVPLTVIIGTKELISKEMTTGWAEETNFTPDFLELEGGHFFILQHFPELAAIINKQASRTSLA